MIVPVIAIAIAGTGLVITVIVLLVRGGFLLGRLVKQVDSHEAKIDALDAKTDALDAKIDAKFDALDAKIDARFGALDAKIDAKVGALGAKIDTKTASLDAKIDALTAAVQQTNAILVGLANHTHDADGLTVFTIPTGERR